MEKEVLVDGRKIIYFEEGRGPPFLIIHGWSPKPIDDFLNFQKILADKGHRVILLRLPGFNGNENGNGHGCSDYYSSWAMKDYLNCISGFIRATCLDKFFLIGHSMGGAMAIELAVSQPEKIKILVLISPGIIRPTKARFWKWWIFTSGLSIFLTILWLIRAILSFVGIIGLQKFTNNLGAYRRFFFRKNKTMYRIFKSIVAFENTIPYLSKITQPTIVFWGKKDFNYYLFGRGLVKYIPASAVYVISGVGHSIQKDAPEEAIKLIKDFIKKQES